MIYVIADPHREFEDILDFCKENHTSTEDILIILGDAEINYYLDYRDSKLKEELSQCPITFFSVYGNHEERPEYVFGYQEKSWHGGKVYYQDVYPNLLFAKDGEIYDFAGKKAIVIGGAYSVDKYYRVKNQEPWFCTEQPPEKIKAYVEAQLEKYGWKVDYVFSHTVPLKYVPERKLLPFICQEEVDKSTEEWLDRIEGRLDYGRWYCGHYHCDMEIDRVRILYWQIKELEDVCTI